MSFIIQESGDVVDVWCFQTELEHRDSSRERGQSVTTAYIKEMILHKGDMIWAADP